MDSLRETIHQSISKVLPHQHHVDDIVDFVLGQGVKKPTDLRRLTIAILNEILDYVDSCDLHEEWQRTYGDVSVGSKPTPQTATGATPQTVNSLPRATPQSGTDFSRAGPSNAPQTQSSLRPSDGDLQSAADEVLEPVFPDISVSSPYFPSAVREAIKAKKRPSTSAREDMVGRLVDRCRETIPNFQRKEWSRLALKIVTLYPDSFKDTLLISEHGSDSLAKQFKIKYDNDRRPTDSRVGKENTAPALPQAYGCVEWSPALPEGETIESQEQTMRELKQMYTIPKKDMEPRIIKTKLISSFYLQRQHINGPSLQKPPKKGMKRSHPESQSTDDPTESQPSNIPSLKENWPFLFTPLGMHIHFYLLTKVNFKEQLTQFISEESEVLIDFLGSRNETLAVLKRRMIRAEQQSRGFARLGGILTMLIQHFGDDLSSLITFTEKTDTFEDMKNYKDLPPGRTPILVVAGTSVYEYDRIFVFIDNIVVACVKNLQEAFVMLFCSYFAMNIHYAPGLVSLLCYTQRVIANINPVGNKGSKCGNPHATKRANDKIVRFANKISDYKQQLAIEATQEL